jgi:hypothetical protein
LAHCAISTVLVGQALQLVIPEANTVSIPKLDNVPGDITVSHILRTDSPGRGVRGRPFGTSDGEYVLVEFSRKGSRSAL